MLSDSTNQAISHVSLLSSICNSVILDRLVMWSDCTKQFPVESIPCDYKSIKWITCVCAGEKYLDPDQITITSQGQKGGTKLESIFTRIMQLN